MYATYLPNGLSYSEGALTDEQWGWIKEAELEAAKLTAQTGERYDVYLMPMGFSFVDKVGANLPYLTLAEVLAQE
jgi:hypothetical protein